VDPHATPLQVVQQQLYMQEGFDVGLEMSGNPGAFRDMLTNISLGAKIAMLGIPSEDISINWNQVVFNQLTTRGIYGREMYETWYKMTVMLESGLDISSVITHRLNWRDYEAGFAAVRSGNSGKVILDWRDVS
jgi:threonine 3-dehydrogenase